MGMRHASFDEVSSCLEAVGKGVGGMGKGRLLSLGSSVGSLFLGFSMFLLVPSEGSDS